MSYDYYDILLVFSLLFVLTSANSYSNITFGHIENLNYFLGESHPRNLSHSWRIHNEKQAVPSYYFISLRRIEIDNEENFTPHELAFRTDRTQIILGNINQQVIAIPSSGDLQIDIRQKTLAKSLNIHRFLLEFFYVNNKNNGTDYFRCAKSGVLIPKQWRCNCLHECLPDDYSDEADCPVCSIVDSTNSLLCHSHERWCLPSNNRTNSIDPKGNFLPILMNNFTCIT